MFSGMDARWTFSAGEAPDSVSLHSGYVGYTRSIQKFILEGPMKKQVLLLIVTLLTSVLTFAAPTLSDNEAKRLLEETWSKGFTSIALGPL